MLGTGHSGALRRRSESSSCPAAFLARLDRNAAAPASAVSLRLRSGWWRSSSLTAALLRGLIGNQRCRQRQRHAKDNRYNGASSTLRMKDNATKT